MGERWHGNPGVLGSSPGPVTVLLAFSQKLLYSSQSVFHSRVQTNREGRQTEIKSEEGEPDRPTVKRSEGDTH